MRKPITIALSALALSAAAITGAGLAASGSHAAAVPAAQPTVTHSAPAVPVPPKAPSTYNLSAGAVVQVTDTDTNSTYTVTVNSIGAYSPGEYDSPAPGGMHYIVANVTYKVQSGYASPNEFDWESKASNGQTHDAMFLGADNGELSSNNVAAGNLVSGNVYFAVSNDSQYGNTIVYSGGLNELGSWIIPSYLG